MLPNRCPCGCRCRPTRPPLLDLAASTYNVGTLSDAVWGVGGTIHSARSSRTWPRSECSSRTDVRSGDARVHRRHLALFDVASIGALDTAAIRRVDAYKGLLASLSQTRDDGDTVDPADVRSVLAAHTSANGFAAADPVQLGRVLGVDAAIASGAAARISIPTAAIDALRTFLVALHTAAELGVSVEALTNVGSTDYAKLSAAAAALNGALHVRARPTTMDSQRGAGGGQGPWPAARCTRRRAALLGQPRVRLRGARSTSISSSMSSSRGAHARPGSQPRSRARSCTCTAAG